MTLSKLIRKRATGKIATAIPAIPATGTEGQAGTVARVATVAVAATVQTKIAQMTTEEEEAVRAWLVRIGETDTEIIADVMDKCRWDVEARAYCLTR